MFSILLCFFFLYFLFFFVFVFVLETQKALMACARSKVGFDKENETSCDNYKCFKLLLQQNDEYFSEAKLIVNSQYGKSSNNSGQ